MAGDLFGILGTVQAGTYRVESVVAEGGFGVVYRAYHEAFRAPVALKCLKVPEAMAPEHQAEFLEKFRAEGELLFRLSASLPAVVRPLHVDALTTPAGLFVPFMALEWLTGETLAEWVEARQARGEPNVSLAELAKLLTPVARALARAHKFPGPNGPVAIVHRDLKPDNIFIANVNGEQVVKVLDFGIAKARSAATAIVGRQSQHQSALVAFSPGFAAPEQWVPKRFGQSGPWTDVYGLALTMIEVLLGSPVLPGGPSEMMTATLDEATRPTPRTRGLSVSDSVERAFARALAVDPAHRYPDVGTFWDDLESALGLAASAPTRRMITEAPTSDDPDADSPRTKIPSLPPPPPPPPPSPTAPRHALELPEEAAPAITLAGPVELAPGPAPAPAAGPAAVEKLPSLAPVAPSPARPRPRPRIESVPPALAGDWPALLMGPGIVLALGVAITVLVNAYAGSHGEVPAIGPIRLTWVGGLLSAIGLALGVWRVVQARSE